MLIFLTSLSLTSNFFEGKGTGGGQFGLICKKREKHKKIAHSLIICKAIFSHVHHSLLCAYVSLFK